MLCAAMSRWNQTHIHRVPVIRFSASSAALYQLTSFRELRKDSLQNSFDALLWSWRSVEHICILSQGWEKEVNVLENCERVWPRRLQCLMHSASNTLEKKPTAVHVFFSVNFSKRNLMHTWIRPDTCTAEHNRTRFHTLAVQIRTYAIYIFQPWHVPCAFFCVKELLRTLAHVGLSFNVCSNGRCPQREQKKKQLC